MRREEKAVAAEAGLQILELEPEGVRRVGLAGSFAFIALTQLDSWGAHFL
jgi:hypothetical protein